MTSKKNKTNQELADEIEHLKNRISDLESTTMPLQPIEFADAEVYCVECGYVMHYNFYKPFTTPSKCSKCGSRMTDKQTEEIMKSLEEHIKKAKPIIEKRKKMIRKQPNTDK